MKIKKFMKGFRQGEKGFTLIELLVVVVILGTLAAIVIPNVTRFMDAGEDEAANTELANVQTAITALMFENGGALAAAYAGVDTQAEVTAVLGETGGTLYEYLLGGEYPLKQAYNISTDGSVVVTP